MNLLFYTAVNAGRFHFPSFRIAQPISGRRPSNFEAVTKVLIFFRYFAPGRIIQYIDNCRRRNEEAARSILDSLPRGVGEFSVITYMMGSPAIKMRMATLLSHIESNAGPSLINHSFTWANTPQGRNVWERLDSLYENFHQFITDNHVPLDLTSNDYDRSLYPILQNDDSLRDYLVPLPESVSENQPRPRRRARVQYINPEDIQVSVQEATNQASARPTMSDVRYEGNNTYSYTGPDGQRHTIQLPPATATFSFDESITSSSTSGTSGTI